VGVAATVPPSPTPLAPNGLVVLVGVVLNAQKRYAGPVHTSSGV
jgi:hypothetical protein